MQLYQQLPPEVVKIALVLFLSFLTGLEREGHKVAAQSYSFGGVRTFPLIGLIGYALALLSGQHLLPLTAGFIAIAGFLLVSYWHKLSCTEVAGMTTEMSGVCTFLVGALIYYGHFWTATAISVASLLLLDLKSALEKLAVRIPSEEILTFVKFLLLTGVILPVLPNHEYSRFHINPFKTWLVVLAVSTISYGSYVLQRLTKERGGVVLAAVLGGAYSSTVTTVVMARRAAREQHAHLFAGGILIASGIMYLRLVVLLGLFNRQLASLLAVPFLALTLLGVGVGWLWSRGSDGGAETTPEASNPQNPLELLAACLFALLFLAMLVATQLAATYLGRAGVNTLAAFMGVTDVDPFILGMTQSAGTLTSLRVAAAAVVIAAASNNLIKGVYAYVIADRKTGVESLSLLTALALAGLSPLLWLGS